MRTHLGVKGYGESMRDKALSFKIYIMEPCLSVFLAYNVSHKDLYYVLRGDYPILLQSTSKNHCLSRWKPLDDGLPWNPLRRYSTIALADHLQSAETCPEWLSADSFHPQDLDSNSLDNIR